MVYKGMVDIKCDFGTDSDEFKQYVGRFPKNKEELEEYAHYCKKGVDAQLDWEEICKCASNEVE